jgi:hypothetical protein
MVKVFLKIISKMLCHPPEGSLTIGTGILRFAQDDMFESSSNNEEFPAGRVYGRSQSASNRASNWS